MNRLIKIEEVENGFVVETYDPYTAKKGIVPTERRRIETRLDRVLKQVEKLFKEKG